MTLRIDEPGWIKIPLKYRDPAERRAVWYRLDRKDSQDNQSIEGIELCAGREGDDLYVSFREYQTVSREDLYWLSEVLSYGDTLRSYEKGILEPGPRATDDPLRQALGDNAEQIRDAQFQVSYRFNDEPTSLYCIGCGAESKEKSSYGGFKYPTCKPDCSWTRLVAVANKCE